jgi:5-formyltetrahydrofolate cyclo-ligase
VVSVYGAHLRKQATETVVTDGFGGTATSLPARRFPPIREARLTSPQNLVLRKVSLRALALERRAGIPAAYRDHAARAVAALLADELPIPDGATVAGYWPLAGELDPRPGLDRLRARGHPLALPRLDGREQPLLFLAWDAGDVLVKGAFKLLEPEPWRPVRVPDVVLAPLLAFDRRGGRLGYGKGFYDRTLRHLERAARRPLAIGLAFADQEVDDVPAGPDDVPLDGVITERALHRFVEAGGRP